MDLIVMVPGIMGTVLRRHGATAWGYSGATAATTLLTRGAAMNAALALDGDDPDRDDLGDGIAVGPLMPDLHLLPGLWKIDGYEKVRTTLCQELGLQPGLSYLEVGYDWRRDNRVAARRLARSCRDGLVAWRRHDPNAKIIILAHSMGGLVARYFLEVLEGWKTGDVRALVTFGTPFRGSPNALDILANGLHRGSVDLTAMSRSFTSVYQLLPIYPAYDPGDGTYRRVGETTGVPNIDAQRARAALAFHHEIRDAVAANRADPRWPTRGYTVYPIVGRMQTTLQAGAVGAGDGLLMTTTYRGVEVRGDGTVPLPAAVPLEVPTNGPQADLYAATKHGSLQNADAVLTHLIGRINEFALAFGDFRGPDLAEAQIGAAIGLEAPDLVRSDEPVLVRGRAPEGIDLTAELTQVNPPYAAFTQPMALTADGGQEAEFAPVPAGHYRVRLTGPGLGAAPEDAIAVADAVLATEEV